MGTAEDELLAGAVRGDADALSAMLERYGPQVRNALRIGTRWQSVLSPDDVMQVTYFEAFLRIGDFTPYGEGAFYKWLLRIAENNLRDAIKELGRDKRTPPEKRIEPLGNSDSFQALYERLGTTSTTPSRELARGEAQGFLESAISRLPPDYQKVVRLYDLEGGSVAEVTAALGRSKGALFMLRARAHDRLRDILGTGTQFAGGA